MGGVCRIVRAVGGLVIDELDGGGVGGGEAEEDVIADIVADSASVP